MSAREKFNERDDNGERTDNSECHSVDLCAQLRDGFSEISFRYEFLFNDLAHDLGLLFCKLLRCANRLEPLCNCKRIDGHAFNGIIDRTVVNVLSPPPVSLLLGLLAFNWFTQDEPAIDR